MGKENINSNELKKNICLKTGHFEFDEVSEEDLGRVTEIALRGVKFNGEPTDVNLKELAELYNLTDLLLSTVTLNKELLENLRQLKLKSFQLVNSRLEEDTVIDFGDEIDRVDIKSTEGIEKARIVSPQSLFISDSKVDFSKLDLSRARNIYLQDCVIIGYEDPSKFESLEYINFDGSTVEDKEGNPIVEFTLRDGIFISHEEESRKADDRDRE